MIEPIGIKPGVVTDRQPASSDPVSAVVPINRVRPSVIAETGARVVVGQLAASAPVDLDRVQTIRRAIAEGRFPIAPADIADRLIAAHHDWADQK